jgi:hypothetical protein
MLHSGQLKQILSDLVDLAEKAVGSGHAGDLRQRIAELPEPQPEPGAPKDNPWAGHTDAEVLEAALGGDQGAVDEYRARQAAALGEKPAAPAPTPA